MPGRGSLVALGVLVSSLAISGAAMAGAWAGANPGSNLKPAPLPAACYVHPRGTACINAGVYYLDKARARLHQKAYKLPADFAKLAPDRQVLILTNLDRTRYGLPPITGLTKALDSDALGGRAGDPLGVLGDGDPKPTDPRLPNYNSNWAGGLPNIVLAYESWMYNDGPGSTNQDCPPFGTGGCWGHRHNVLARLSGTGPTAMGAAAGKDHKGLSGYAMILAKGTGSYKPSYTYRWGQAKAAGAGKHTYTVPKPQATGSVKIGAVKENPAGTALLTTIKAPGGVPLKLTLSKKVAGNWVVLLTSHPEANKLISLPIPAAVGSYRISVKSALGAASATYTSF